MKAYLLSDPAIGERKVPQDSEYNGGINPAAPVGRNFVEGSYLHKGGFWGGSQGCIIQRGFEEKGGMGAYLEESKTGQSGHVMIFR